MSNISKKKAGICPVLYQSLKEQTSVRFNTRVQKADTALVYTRVKRSRALYQSLKVDITLAYIIVKTTDYDPV